MTLIIGSFTYLQTANMNRWKDVDKMRTAYDVGLGLDRMGVFSSNNRSFIESSLAQVLPVQYNASLQVFTYWDVGGNLTLIQSRTYGQAVSEPYLTEDFVSSDKLGGFYLARLRVGEKND
jgi:hypothetical protein